MAAARRILLVKRAISAGKPLFPSAFNYDDVIGEIWMLEMGNYDDDYRIQLLSPEGPQGGYYDNR